MHVVREPAVDDSSECLGYVVSARRSLPHPGPPNSVFASAPVEDGCLTRQLALIYLCESFKLRGEASLFHGALSREP